MTAQSVYVGKKQLSFNLPEEIPTLDQDQIKAAHAMYEHKSLLLISEPGAGKTITALDALIRVEIMQTKVKTLILCPTIAIRTWAVWVCATYELLDFPCRMQIIRGNKDKIDPKATHLIVTYGTLSRKGGYKAQELHDWGADVLICDESDNLSGVSSTRTSVVLGESGKGGIAKDIEWAWFLTGTPIPRYQDGLYPVLSCRFPQVLEAHAALNKSDFLKKFCRQRKVIYGNMRFPKTIVSGNRNKYVMNRLLYDTSPPVAIRNKLDMGNLKLIKHEVTFDIKMSKELKALEKEVEEIGPLEEEAMAHGIGVVNPKTATALHLLGVELAPHVADYIADLIREKRNRGDTRGVLGLFWHTHVGTGLYQHLKAVNLNVGIISGSTSKVVRELAEDEFNNGDNDVLLGQIASMGVALNLQHNCNHVVFAEDTYSDAANEQAYRRVWRRGQKDNVHVDFCKTLSFLSDLRPKVSKRKGNDARAILD